MLETQQRGCKSLQTDGSVPVLVTLEHSATAKVLMHLAVFSENSLTDAQNVITGVLHGNKINAEVTVNSDLQIPSAAVII